jgi:proteasome lid subunit RPN8/RPN11
MPLAHPPDPPAIVVIAQPVRDSINAIWLRNNLHWNELTDQNTLTQMLGTGKPTQHEYLGCLIGHTAGDTVYVTDWTPAQHMHQWQFAVTGDCKHVAHLVGTWHTHPYRADSANHPLKEPVLSSTDLSTFAKGTDHVVLAAWDADSIDVAVRGADGIVQHPAQVVITSR